MPRKAREKSESGIYHIMLRGINRQSIFEDEEDYEKFIETIRRYKEPCGYEMEVVRGTGLLTTPPF